MCHQSSTQIQSSFDPLFVIACSTQFACKQDHALCRGLANLQQQTIVVHAEELAGGEYSLTNLQGCTVHLQGPMSALQIRDLIDCKVSTGPVTGPTFVYGESWQVLCPYSQR